MKIIRSVAAGRRARGFTMVELLVVMAIIAILALLAAPNFQDTIVRNEIKEALPLADIAKQPVALMWSMTRTFPSTNDDVLLPSPEKIVSNLVKWVAVRDGAINVTFGNRANGQLRIEIELRTELHFDVPLHQLGEALLGDGQRIDADGEARQKILAGPVRLHLNALRQYGGGGVNDRAGDSSPGGVGDNARDKSIIFLRPRGCDATGEQGESEKSSRGDPCELTAIAV